MAAPAPSVVASDDESRSTRSTFAVASQACPRPAPSPAATPSCRPAGRPSAGPVALRLPRRDGRKAPGVDTLDCAVWRGDLRRRVASWSMATGSRSSGPSTAASGARAPESRAATRSRR